MMQAFLIQLLTCYLAWFYGDSPPPCAKIMDFDAVPFWAHVPDAGGYIDKLLVDGFHVMNTWFNPFSQNIGDILDAWYHMIILYDIAWYCMYAIGFHF